MSKSVLSAGENAEFKQKGPYGRYLERERENGHIENRMAEGIRDRKANRTSEFPLKSINCPQLSVTAAKVAFTEYLYHFFVILTTQQQTGLGWRQEILSTMPDLTHGEGEQ